MTGDAIRQLLGDEFFQELSNWISDAVTRYFEIHSGNGYFYNIGIYIWNWAMSIMGLLTSTTPQSFSSEAWTYTTTTVLDFSMGIAAALLNIFYLIGIIRLSTNLKEAFTLEVFVDSIIKVLLGNLLILNGKDLIVIMFDIASVSANAFLLDVTSFSQTDVDVGSIMFNFVFGIIFMIVCLVCAAMIFLTLYNRYLWLYMLVAVYPFAFSTLPGGRGINNTASAWTRTFLSKTLEIVVIAIAVSIASKMCMSIDFGTMEGLAAGLDGAIQTIQSMATMIILTGAVKGTDLFMRRAFGL